MKGKVLVKSLLMGMICPAIIYIAAAVFDVITQESNASLVVMFIEGVLLLILPVFFLIREKELEQQFPTKLTAPVYLFGYAVITLVMIYITDSLDMDKLFAHKFLGGIGLVIMYIILAGGFVWALLFRTGVLIAKCISSAQEKKKS